MATERDEAYWLRGTITMLEARVEGLEFELHVRDLRLAGKDKYIAELEQRVEELKRQAVRQDAVPAATPPPFVKPGVPRRRRKKAGREAGHEAALRPPPRRIDRHQDVPLESDGRGRPVCPRCSARLTELRRHRRVVEDLIRSTVQATCYHTRSGLCPNCSRRVESRGAEQPPAADLPHGQLGINALTTAAILRVRHRLPFRQVAQLLADFYGGYDRLKGPKQRCLTHLTREVKELGEADASFADCPLSRKLLRWCKEALRLKRRWGALPDASYEIKASRLEDRLDQLVRGDHDHADAKRLCKRLRRHRKDLTRFLWDEKLDGTNNAAERALRPAVVMRKITGGSRSASGASAWAKLASLLRTADQRGLGVYDATKKLILDYWAGGGR